MQVLKNALSDGVVIINFRKVDGSLREMTATTNRQLFSYTSKSQDTAPALPNPNILKVWDLDKNAWRSIKIDSIISWHKKS